MLEVVRVVPGDTIIDLGSGDGRLVTDAAKLGTYAIGIEFEKQMVVLSVGRAVELGVAERSEMKYVL